MDRSHLSLRDRTIVLLANFTIFYVVFVIAANRFLPTGGLESVWLLAALALWFLALLSAPWFVPPRDALANAIGAVAILVTIDLNNVAQFAQPLNVIRWVAVGYAGIVSIASLVALLLHDKDKESPWSGLSFRIASIFGAGELLYTPPAIVSIVGAYGNQHTRLIPNLRNLEFLAFGKAVRAERPILLKREFDAKKKAASLNFAAPSAEEADSPI